MKRIVVVDLAGGIGNQIFLLEAAMFIASFNNGMVLINTTRIDRYHSSGKSTIEDFSLPENVRYFKLNIFVDFIYFRLKVFLKFFNKFNRFPFLVLNEAYSNYKRSEIANIIVQKNARIILLSGYWQNFTYWSNDLKYELRLERDQLHKVLNEMKSESPVVFHYRLGKLYNKWEHGWGALSPNYLLNALATLENSIHNSLVVWVFSNDLMEAKKLLEPLDCTPYKLFFIDDSKFSPAEIVVLFSKAKILICSNSTLSIVAAKIGDVEKVIVPSELSKNGHENIELPNIWRKVKSDWLD